MILAKIQAPFPISFLHKRRHGEKQGVFHVKHRYGDVSRETSQGRASLRGGELKERRFRAEIIYFLVCCHFLFAAKGSVLWRRCGRKMGRAAATAQKAEACGLVRTLGDVSRPRGRSHAEARCPTARTASREGSPETDACRLCAVGNGECPTLAARIGAGGSAERARHPPDGGLWLRRRPEQARPDAVRRSPKKGGHPAMSALNVHPEKVGRGAYRPACAGRRCPGISAP